MYVRFLEFPMSAYKLYECTQMFFQKCIYGISYKIIEFPNANNIVSRGTFIRLRKSQNKAVLMILHFSFQIMSLPVVAACYFYTLFNNLTTRCDINEIKDSTNSIMQYYWFIACSMNYFQRIVIKTCRKSFFFTKPFKMSWMTLCSVLPTGN